MSAPAERGFDPDALRLPLGSFIAGRLVDGDADEIAIARPSDGKVVARIRGAGAGLVDDAVRAADRAFKATDWAHGEPRARGAVLRRWADLVERDTEELARLESAFSSRVIAETRIRDVRITVDLLRFYGECADKHEGHVYATRANVLSLGLAEPYGVVAAIAPWNVPMVLATAKFAPALAAGNAVVLKPSELTPFTAIRLAELAIEAGLPAGLFNVVVGLGPDAGSPLVRHRHVGYVTFTGSTATGTKVMVDAATSGLKPVSLELGGKSPQIVFADAPDLDRVADLVAAGACRNAGQLCYCGSRLVVDRTVADDLMARVAARMSRSRPGATWDAATTLAPIVSRAQATRIADIVARGRAAGATIRLGGAANDDGPGGAYFMPTIAEAAPDNPLIREEVFGPVLSVQTFDDAEEAFALADHPVYGLTGAVHSANIDRALGAARRLDAGMIWVNAYGRSLDIGTPFGGFKGSGFGKDFGVAAFEKYQRTKCVWIETRA